MFGLFLICMRVGLRSSGFKALAFVSLLVIGAAVLASSFSGRQPVTVGVDVGLSGIRFVSLLLALFWVQDLLAKDIERKTLYFMLAYPYSRAQFLLARFFALALLAVLPVVLLGGLLLLAIYLMGDYQQLSPIAQDGRYALALLGIWLDLLVVIAFAVLICTISTTPFLPLLLGMAFALSARGLGPAFDYLRSEGLANPTQGRIIQGVLEYAYLVLPDLSRLDWRPYTLYGLPVDVSAVGLASLMGLAYVGVMLLAAVLLFQRRDLT